MRFAFGALASAATLFASAAVGLVGTWGLPVGAVALVMAAVAASGAMDARDHPFGVEGMAVRREARETVELVAKPVEH